MTRVGTGFIGSGFVMRAMKLVFVFCQRFQLYKFDIHGSVHRRLLSRNTNKMQLYNRIYYSKVF